MLRDNFKKTVRMWWKLEEIQRHIHRAMVEAQPHQQRPQEEVLTETLSVQLQMQIQQGSLLLFQQQEPCSSALGSHPGSGNKTAKFPRKLTSLKTQHYQPKKPQRYPKDPSFVESKWWEKKYSIKSNHQIPKNQLRILCSPKLTTTITHKTKKIKNTPSYAYILQLRKFFISITSNP